VDIAAAGVGNQGGTIVPGVVQAVRPNVGEAAGREDGAGESRQGPPAKEMRVERAIGGDSISGNGLTRVSASTSGRTAENTAGIAAGSGIEVAVGESTVAREGRGLGDGEAVTLSAVESTAVGDHGPVPIGATAKAIESRPDAVAGPAASGPSARGEIDVGRAAGRLSPDALPGNREGAGLDTDSLMSSSSEKALARIDVEVSDSGGPRTGIVADISGAGTAEEPPRTLISAELSEVPASVPEKAIYKLRSPERRKQFIEELGGTKQTEQAVELALVWLAGAQSDDGRWDVDGFKTLSACGGAGDRSDGDVALTGLAVLSYLGAGYTHVKGEHADTVRKALNWLVVGQKEDGDLQRDGQMYGQAMAAAALCECYSMTGDKRLLQPVQRAVDFILKAQNPEAGWRYAPRKDNDTSVTGWQVLALKSAMIAGIEIPARHFQWVEQWLDKVRRGQEGGLYTYMQGHGATPTMTAEGWFCQLLMSEQTRTRGQAETVPYLMAHPPVWTTTRDGSVNLYYWYYATLALHMSGAPEFGAWNEALTKGLLPGQEKKGPSAGSWDPVCQLGERGGRVYSTATAALCLEVYYRYLPFYRQK
jgi:hypothetical protein